MVALGARGHGRRHFGDVVVPRRACTGSHALRLAFLAAICSSDWLSLSAAGTIPSINLPPLPAASDNNYTAIPRVFHFIWPNKKFTFDAKHTVEETETHRYVSRLKGLHRGWEVHVWTDDECEELVRLIGQSTWLYGRLSRQG